MTDLPTRRARTEIDAVAASESYRTLLERLRERIREAQARAARAVNAELVGLYWQVGRDILTQQQASDWGDDVIGRIAHDLSGAVGSSRGFSRRNLFYMRRFAELWPDLEKVQPLAAQIGWTHHQVLLDAFADQPDLYAWYASKAAENRWSRRHLKGQIDLRLHERQGAAITNFPAALEPADAQRALEATKDPYVFEFPRARRERPRAPARASADRRHPEPAPRARHGIRVLRPPTALAGRRSRVLPRPALLPPRAATVCDYRPEDRRVSGRVRLQDEPLPQRRRRAASSRR